MKNVLILLLVLLSNDPKEIAKVNSLKEQAEAAYLSGEYETALSKYSFLKDSLGVNEPAINLNVAHAYYHLGDTAGAKRNYNSLTSSASQKMKSVALQQLGVMNKDAGKLEESLQQLKTAIKADPTNQDARYNYEVVKKLLEEQQQQNQDQQNQDQQNKDGEENQDQQQKDDQQKDGENQDENQKNQENQEQEKSEEENQEQNQQEQQQNEGEEEEQKSQEQMTKEKLEEMGISEEKARQLLEAMRQSEIKYLQNQRRKATKRPPSGKPDW